MAVAQLLLFAAVTVQLLFFSPAASSSYYCDWSPRRSTASVLPPGAAGLGGAACGYGPTAAELGLAGGYHIAAATPEFFRDGRGCGACHQLRCRDRRVCGEAGVKVVVADVVPPETVTTTTNRTVGRFVLAKDAFTAMARPNHDHHAMPDQLEVDFRRIPCVYKQKLAVRVGETSSWSHGHLAIRFLYQGGQTDIAAVEVARAHNATSASAATPPPPWRYMTRSRREASVVWRTSRAPAGPLRLRVVVTAGSGGKWLRAEREVIPAEWQPGGVYDTGLRVTDVALRTCGAAAGDEDDDQELR